LIYLHIEYKKKYPIICFFYQGDEGLCITSFMLLLLFRCLFIQLLILHTLSSTFFLCILTCCYTFLLRKMTRFSLSHTHTYTYFRTPRIFIYITRRCRQCIFFCIVVVLSLSLSMPILTCSFRTRERGVRG
jgi:hypothetical protein